MKKKILNQISLPFFKRSIEIASKSEVTYSNENNMYIFTFVYSKERQELVNKIIIVGKSIFSNVIINACSDDMLN
jgi:hypothetical protein